MCIRDRLYAMQASTIRVYAMKWYMQRSEVLRLTRSLMRRLLSLSLIHIYADILSDNFALGNLHFIGAGSVGHTLELYGTL